jgi:hypothetical protein
MADRHTAGHDDARASLHRLPRRHDLVVRVNPMPIKNGLEPIVPHPDAYVGCKKSELG